MCVRYRTRSAFILFIRALTVFSKALRYAKEPRPHASHVHDDRRDHVDVTESKGGLHCRQGDRTRGRTRTSDAGRDRTQLHHEHHLSRSLSSASLRSPLARCTLSSPFRRTPVTHCFLLARPRGTRPSLSNRDRRPRCLTAAAHADAPRRPTTPSMGPAPPVSMGAPPPGSMGAHPPVSMGAPTPISMGAHTLFPWGVERAPDRADAPMRRCADALRAPSPCPSTDHTS